MAGGSITPRIWCIFSVSFIGFAGIFPSMTSVVVIEQELTPNAWKFQILKAIIFALFGIFFLVFPFATLNLGAYLISFFLLFISIAALFSGFAAFGEPKTTWWMIVLGIIGIIIAIISFINPTFMVAFSMICVGSSHFISVLTDVILASVTGFLPGSGFLTFILGLLGIAIG